MKFQNTYEVSQTYAGRIVAGRSSALGFQRGGLLVSIVADEGDTVKKGDLIARLDVRSLEANRNEVLAQLDHTQAQRREIIARLELARKNTKRKQALIDKGHVSKKSFEEAQSEENALKAQLGAATAAIKKTETALQTIDVDIELSHLRAPFSGSVTKRVNDEGTAVSFGEAVVHLIEDTALEARFGVPLDAVDTLQTGANYDINVNGTAYIGRLRSVLSEVDVQTRTVFAVFIFEYHAVGLRAGQIGKLSLEREVDSSGFWLPLTALAEGTRGMWNAYALASADNNTGRIERRQLMVLHTEADRVFVRGVLKDGDRVVSTGLHRLVPGQLVLAN